MSATLRGGVVVVAVALACAVAPGCDFAAFDGGSGLATGLWHPPDGGVAAERSLAHRGLLPDRGSQPDGPALPVSGPPVASDAGTPSSGAAIAAPWSRDGATAFDPAADVDDRLPMLASHDASVMLDAGVGIDAGSMQDAASEPVECSLGMRYCDGLEFVYCGRDRILRRRVCTANRCEVATCDDWFGCDSEPVEATPCDDGGDCPRGQTCDDGICTGGDMSDCMGPDAGQ